ncbi:neuromedin-U receptor 2-like [Patiria miniata]|uniref:G-protein coupled receptors family 1 profile domain-containing protein n=1 Tax=Patiria miniata TaxID=46514 RepID=A0A914A6S7_PATMI|nr:neuromedin-U receptor 2-like [Patiria miniata]
MDTATVLQILKTITGILGIAGNGLVCVVIAKVPAMRTLTNTFIFNQALVDFLASLSMILQSNIHISSLSPNRVIAFLQCNVWETSLILWTFFTASTFNLVLLTSERYFAIVYPFRYLAYFSIRRATAMIVVVWLLAIGYKFHIVVYHQIEKGECVPATLSKTALRVDGTITFLIEYLLPLIFMASCYIHIILQLKKASSIVHAEPSTSQQGDNSMSGSLLRARRNTLKTLFIVFLTYTICWSPSQIAFFMYNFGLDLNLQGAFFIIFVVLAQLNSCVNPVIYAFKYKQFQRGARALLKSCFPSLTEPRNEDNVGLSIIVRSKTQAKSAKQGPTTNNGADSKSAETG